MANGVNENPQQNIASNPKGEKQSAGQLFNVIIWFDNHTIEKYQLPTQHIIELAFEENLLDWPRKGYLIYNNKWEAIERNLDPNAYFYRMDARDDLTIEVKLIPSEPAEIELPQDIWEMKLEFVVYDTEDLPANNIATKLKKVYFWDKKYQMMLDKKIPWSTTIAQEITNASHLTDNERSMFTGDAIKALLTKPTGAGYENSIDEENWDVGMVKQFYTAPAQNSIIDTLKALLSSHISSNNKDCVIFKYKNRFDNQWQLIPLHKFFENAGNSPSNPGIWQLEHFFFEDIEPGGEGITSPYRSPYKDDLSFEIDIKMIEWGKITTYDFTDMSGIDNSKALVSKPIHNYFFETGMFNVDYQDNEIENVKKDFKLLYTDKLLPAGKAEPIFTLNETKKQQINIDPQFMYARYGGTETKEQRLTDGRCKILFAGVFLNEFIKFRVLGSPHRTIGKFIGIERRTSDEKLKFDNKICGQWLVTNVKHIWNHNRYVNDISAVKVHMYSSNNINEKIS